MSESKKIKQYSANLRPRGDASKTSGRRENEIGRLGRGAWITGTDGQARLCFQFFEIVTRMMMSAVMIFL